MKQILDLLISALKELEKASKTEDVIRLEEKVELIIKDLKGLIEENNYSENDKDLKQILMTQTTSYLGFSPCV